MKYTNRKNIKKMDEAISNLIMKLEDETLGTIQKADIDDRIELLVESRAKLYDSQQTNTIPKTVVSGVFGIAGLLLVLHYEKVDIITSKAFNIVTRMIEG